MVIGGKREYLLDMGIGEALMHGCSDVQITGEFASFFEITFDAVVLGIPSRLKISIKGLEEERIFCDNGFHWALQRGGMVRSCLESDFCDCCMGEAYEEG